MSEATPTPTPSPEPPPPPEPILALRDVTIAPRRRFSRGLQGVNLRLVPGELALIQVDRLAPCPPLAEAALGLIPPAHGTAEFEGQDWQSMSPTRVSLARSRIGRVFDTGGWVSNLDVVENVILARRHHRRESIGRLTAKADDLARRFSLERVPRERPSDVAPVELRKSQWVRALLGEPVLVLLERPLRGVPGSGVAALRKEIGTALDRGAAVVWLTSEPDELADLGARAAQRWELIDQHFKPLGEVAA